MRISISKDNLKQGITGTAGLLAVLVLWALLAQNYHPLILPSPRDTLMALADLHESGSLWLNIGITLKRTLLGYCLALLGGFILALLLRSFTFWQALTRPLITIIQVIPPVIWLLLAVIWFGIADDLTPVFLIFIVTFPMTYVNMAASLDTIDPKLVEMARVYRTPRKKIVTQIYLPSLIPQLVSNISVGISFAWKSTIFAEYMGSTSGVGYALSVANANLETDKLFAWAMVLVCVMLFCEYGILRPMERRVMRWSA